MSSTTAHSSVDWQPRKSVLEIPPQPPTALARYRPLSATAGVRVSPLCLGGMSIGDKWEKYGMGAMNKESSFELLDAFYNAGGNFIDTASNYQDESSEQFIGEWMETRGVRPQMVIATKYSSAYKRGDPTIPVAHHSAAFSGNSLKCIRNSVVDSLRKLRTDYIDILYVHWWDWMTSIEEIMRGLNQLVTEGKVLYLGISDAPAWIVSRANQFARDHALAPFVIYQGHWNVLTRDFERDIIPMARAEGMALAPWNVLYGGKIRTTEEETRRETSGELGRRFVDPSWKRNDRERAMCDVLEEIAKEVNVDSDIQAVAIAYLMHKTQSVFPIVGMRKVSQLQSNMLALSISLSAEQLKRIEAAGGPFAVGVPHDIVGDGTEFGFLQIVLNQAHIDLLPVAPPVKSVVATPAS